MPARRQLPLVLSALTAGILLGSGTLAAAPALAATADSWPLMVTEIVPDTEGTDEFEFFEVTNTTSAPIDLDAEGIRFVYTGTSALPTLTREEPVVIQPGASTVFWLSYANTEGTLDSFRYSEDDFRDRFPATATAGYDIVRVTGQAGMANTSPRGIRIERADGTVISAATYQPAQVGVHIGANFGVPSAGTGTELEHRSSGAPTPGAVDPAVLSPLPTEPGDPGGDPTGVADAWPLVVTEIQADNSGTDNYEYFEVANTTDRDLDLAAEGFGFAYTYVDSADRTDDVPLAFEPGTVIPAGEAAVFWFIYGERETIPVEQFRAFYGIGADVPVVRVTGQPGFANAGDRGIRVVHGDEIVGWSFAAAGSVASHQTAVFRVPFDLTARSMPLHQAKAAPTPGTVDPATLRRERLTDPALQTAPLQVTELLPDSSNVAGADAFEFIEVYNATDAPVDWADYTIRYLYPLADLTNSSTALWPSTPRSTVIQPGGTLVLWIKNGANTALDAADFNEKFGSDLEAGVDLLEIESGGMANSGARGVEIITNTGVSFNRAYYNLGGVDDTVADQGIPFQTNPDDLTMQLKAALEPATPGSVGDDQVPPALMAAPDDQAAPQIVDQTAATFTPGEGVEFVAEIDDDVLVRTVTLELANGVDPGTSMLNLTADGTGTFRFTLPGVDTIGKDAYTYRIIASDGVHSSDTGTRTMSSTVATPAVRMPYADGQFVRGTVPVSAAGEEYPPTLQLSIDGTPVEGHLELERSPVFAFEATQTDAYFRNGVRMGDQVLTIFDQGFYGDIETVTSDIPLDAVDPGEPFSVRIYAGTKAAPEIDPVENNDNFSVTNLRLVLPDGRTLRPAEIDDPTAMIAVGDSGSSVDFVEATFTVPDDAFTARSTPWDTTAVADGPHTLAATSPAGSASAEVLVDNTAPEIATDLEERLYQGEFVIDAEAVDTGAGLESLTAVLDGRDIPLPYPTSSLSLDAADHVVVFTATDALGNTAERRVTFTTPVEEPGNELLSPDDGAEFEEESVELRARVIDPTGDRLDVRFARGFEQVPGAGVEVSAGAATDASDVTRADAQPISAEQAAALGRLDDSAVTTESGSKLPYQLFRITVPADAGPDSMVRVRWDGAANAGAKVRLLILDPAAGEWVELDQALTTGGAPTEFALEGLVAAAEYAEDGAITALVQHSEGFAGDDLSTRTTPVEPNHPEDTPRSAYDFTIAWESDTQYYNANDEIYDRQLSIHDYLLRERADLNLQYLMHTGDIVDQSEDPAQWLRADPAYRKFDEAGLPYGVLAGNHDVNQQTNDYTNYSAWFGEERYAGNPWYGESYLDNRGHYDLITAGGIDFLMLSMGWAPGDAEIAWLNEVLARYPERIAFLELHEFMLTNGGLGPIPQRIMDEVVATNPNVKFVVSGHYHDAFTRLDSFDDTGDGVPDRTVTSMLFDYQGLPEGGQGYLRLLHFDNVGQSITVRTYSDYERDYDSDDPTLDLIHQEFTIPYAQAGIQPVVKTLTTDAFRADILSDETIAEVDDVASGSEPTVTWNAGAGTHGWYVQSTDPHGAVAYSEIRTVVLGVDGGEPGPDPDPGKPTSPSVPVPTEQLPAEPGGITAPDSARPGDPIAITVLGDHAGDWVQVWLHSTPVALGGWTQVGADGRVFAVIPAGTPVGAHRLVVQDASGAVLGWTEITIAAAPAPAGPTGGGLALSGAEATPALLAAALAVALGVLGVALAARRRLARG